MHETAINSMIIYSIPLDFRFVIDNSTQFINLQSTWTPPYGVREGALRKKYMLFQKIYTFSKNIHTFSKNIYIFLKTYILFQKTYIFFKKHTYFFKKHIYFFKNIYTFSKNICFFKRIYLRKNICFFVRLLLEHGVYEKVPCAHACARLSRLSFRALLTS